MQSSPPGHPSVYIYIIYLQATASAADVKSRVTEDEILGAPCCFRWIPFALGGDHLGLHFGALGLTWSLLGRRWAPPGLHWVRQGAQIRYLALL